MRTLTRRITALLAVALLAAALGGCNKEDDSDEADAFSFVTYPGSRYLAQLTELTKQAHKVLKPGQEPPPVAIYDTDASVDDVANFYVKSYGYPGIAPDATNNLSAAKPPAYRRTGDLAADNAGAQPLFEKLGVKPDVAKAHGQYQAVEIQPKPNRPRVTIQRPYFDVTTSQTVDRTLILMAR
jgi:hypothetical protein